MALVLVVSVLAQGAVKKSFGAFGCGSFVAAAVPAFHCNSATKAVAQGFSGVSVSIRQLVSLTNSDRAIYHPAV